MSTDTASSTSRKDGSKKDGSGKKGFWTLSRKGKEDGTEHPPFQPTLPHVNLLPAAIKDAITAGKLRRWFILGGALLLAIVAGIWYLQSNQISSAQDSLARAQAENTQLKADLSELNGVKEMYGQITRLQGIVNTTMASQPESALVLEQLNAAVAAANGGKSMAFSTIDLNYGGIPRDRNLLNPCPNPQPFTTEIAIGCVTFTGDAPSRVQVADLLRALDADPLFFGSFVTTTSVNPGDPGAGTSDSVTFSGSTAVSLEALETKLTPEEIKAIMNPPKPTASPSPSPSGAAS